MDNLTIYECSAIIEQCDKLALENDGEIPDDMLEALVLAQTTSIEKLGKMCGFMKYIEHGIDACKKEEERIAKMRKVAQNRLKSIKKYLTPYVSEQGKPITVGTFKLSIRKSQSVMVSDDFAGEANREWCNKKITYAPDKNNIKMFLKTGAMIPGATLINTQNLQLR